MKKISADFFLRLIIWERLVIGSLYIILSIAFLYFLGKDLGIFVREVLAATNLDVDHQFIHQSLMYISEADDKVFMVISLGLFLCGSLFLIQGYGLYQRKRWAEYLTIIAVGLFIPVEIYEVLSEPTPLLFGVLIVNSAMVLFLIRHKELFLKKGKPLGPRENAVIPE